ncbi:MAG TPA: hypothetical protein VEH49_06280 [Methylomirabilota bacterium]|nr:hypothetical protein [Methylomirabilota bacterium]
MIFGMTILTFVHVALSLIGIATGWIVMLGLLTGKRLDGWTAVFLLTTILTSATGFLFPFHRLLPSHILGIISLVALAIALVARYGRHLAGAWRRIYVITAVLALYLNMFVLVFQAFLKIPSIKALAPTQSEPPFLVAQLAVLALFLVLGIFAAIKFRPEAVSPA